jgi:hypothetical protein
VLGIGGGGDVAGALASARLVEDLGVQSILGGVAWERLPIDPHPGPRPLADIEGARALSGAVALADPDTRTSDGALFAESRMARFLGRETLLVDVLGGPAAIAEGLADAAERLDADLVVGIDVGGDVLGTGAEAGLASPLCDAVMLAALAGVEERGVRAIGGIFGPCCDGELSFEEVVGRLAALCRDGAFIGASPMSAAVVEELQRVVSLIPTEASAQAIRCARGETGLVTIRRGRRQVMLSPIGALTFYFEPRAALGGGAPLAAAVRDANSLEEANDVLHALGVGSELDYERSATDE